MRPVNHFKGCYCFAPVTSPKIDVCFAPYFITTVRFADLELVLV